MTAFSTAASVTFITVSTPRRVPVVPRVLLLLPTATYRAEDFLAAAEAVGAEVVVASERRQALRGPMGDRALRVDLRRPERAAGAVVELAERVRLDAVGSRDTAAAGPGAPSAG